MECGGFALALEETEITYPRDRLYFSLLDYAMCLKIAFSFVRSKRCFVEILEKSIGLVLLGELVNGSGPFLND